MKEVSYWVIGCWVMESHDHEHQESLRYEDDKLQLCRENTYELKERGCKIYS